MIDINNIKRDINSGVSTLLDEYNWGSYLISLFNDFDGMGIVIRDKKGMASKCFSPEYFINNINTHDDFINLVTDAFKNYYIS